MSEFLLIKETAELARVTDSSGSPADVLSHMMACLRELDRLQAGLAAVHLDTAINQFCTQFDLDRDASGLE